MKKTRANIAITTTIFLATFIVFCAFGLDTAFVVLNRFKLQKATETTALASAAYLKSGVIDPNMPSNVLRLHGLKAANITESLSKSVVGDAENYKVKISTEMPSETYFLRFAGVNYVVIKATSAAQTYTQEITDKNFGDVITLDPILTGKYGDDFSVESTCSYYIFAGIDNGSNVVWEDVGCKANVVTADRTVGTKDFKVLDENASFDLSRRCDDKPLAQDSIGLVKYLRVYKDPGTCAGTPSLKVKVLNNVRLITSSEYDK